jgi:hypothetical protein
MPTLGTCRLCLKENVELRRSHFMSRKMYYSGKKRLEFVNLMESGLDPEELVAPLLCDSCEKLFDRNGEREVLSHVKPKLVLKPMPLAERMRLAWARDNNQSAARHDARDFGVDIEKFSYFALSMVWRRVAHQWHPAFPPMDLGQFAEDMRLYLLGEKPFPTDMALIVLVCRDEISRRTWTIPQAFIEAGCLNVAFDVRGIRFRVLMGNVPDFLREADCRGPRKPIFLGDCEKRVRQLWENSKSVSETNERRSH